MRIRCIRCSVPDYFSVRVTRPLEQVLVLWNDQDQWYE